MPGSPFLGSSLWSALSRLRPESFLKWIFLGALVGAICGLGACLFFWGLGWAEHFFQDFLAGRPPIYPAGEHAPAPPTGSPFNPIIFMILPAFGGLVSGLLAQWLAPEVAGPGTDAMIKAFHRASGRVRARVPFVKAIASVMTLATNGSAGRQGPLIQVGAGLGSCVGQLMGLPTRDLRILLLAGASGALAAVFRAPMGSAVITAELLYREDMEGEALIPCIVSAIVAHTIHQVIFGHEPVFSMPEFGFVENLGGLLWFALLGLLFVPAGRLYISAFYSIRDRFFAPMRIPFFLKPALGGLLVGILGLFLPQILGIGYGWLQMAMRGELAVGIMAAAGLLKILSTSLSVASGGSGGVFAPALFIGGMLGGTIGRIGHAWFPEMVHEPGAFVLVGMGGFFAGVAHAPIGSVLMVCEMTKGYSLLVPLLLVATLHSLFNRNRSIYESQLANRFLSPAHESELTVNVLREMKVSEAIDQGTKPVILSHDTTFQAVRDVILGCEGNDFPVVDEKGVLRGILPFKKLKPILMEESLGDLLVAGELMDPPVWVEPQEDLHSALLKFLKSGHEQIPVLSQGPQGPILGILSHQDIISAYHARVSRVRA
jgi:CIC family chloride channel protein